MNYKFLRQLLFLLPAELAHHVTLMALRFTPKLFFKQPLPDPLEILGLKFPNKIGLAAGLDKNADYIDALAKLGFGFIEVGTITPRPQPGNPKPRLFRHLQENALVNCMGFNNKGVDYLVRQLRKTKWRGIIGVNIGKNFDTAIENAIDDYLKCMREVYPYASYITVNISSPNTPDLRQLQFGEYFDNLLKTLKAEQTTLNQQFNRYVPLLVKIAPDLSDEELQQIAQALLKNKIDGVIATNTTIKHAHGKGGLSGAPLTQASTEIIRQLHNIVAEQIPIIGVGGIMSNEDRHAKLDAGASLVQVYTGLIYKGPGLISG